MRKTAVFLLILLLLAACTRAQADAPRLLVMGDSLTGGLYASDEAHAFARLLADELGAELTTCRGTYVHSLLNCELSGYDYIVIEIGLNDVSNWNGGSLPEADWITTYDALVQDAQATGAVVIITTMFHAVDPQFVNYPKYERYNGHIIAIAVNGVLLADVWEATRNCPSCLSQRWQESVFAPGYRGDNFHPNDTGHALIAATIYEALLHHVYLPAVSSDNISGYPAP